ncbi:UNVERIFIED_CONTAM: hypothetical protein Slati_2839600 [Sesamum latifolium]|uniref:Srp40 C-terminal domain-containing protein n=1 Tax=Sesamum latifolium TaxID=2727402 RepID=A0AAW2VC52_9LAMI
MAKKAVELKPEDESLFCLSVALWLENKGFSKVLKRFLSAAQIEYGAEDLKFQRSKKYGWIAQQKQMEVQLVQHPKKLGVNESYVNGKEDEDQRYKISDDLSLSDQKSEVPKESNDEKVCDITMDHSTKKQKDKKKKKNKLMSEPLDVNENQTDVMPEVTESEHKRETTVDKKSKKRSVEAAEDEVNESKKSSKKRKRMAHDENENKLDQEVAGEKSQAGQSDSENCNDKQTDENAKSALNNNGVDKSSQPKSARKQPKNSAEPKTVNAFQRVKVEEVEFVDERLQDNSYWAKDGADSGYGAKAQEVLGQVKGRSV